MGNGTPREDIAKDVINQITSKVQTLLNKKRSQNNCSLTGGFSQSDYIISELEKKLNRRVQTSELGRYAGAIGACILG